YFPLTNSNTANSPIPSVQVQKIVQKLLNKRERNVKESNDLFLQDELKKKMNNYVVKKYMDEKTKKCRSNSCKENDVIENSSKKKKILDNDDDNDDDFIDTTKNKRQKLEEAAKPKNTTIPILSTIKISRTTDVKMCLDEIISEIENNEAICPICSNFFHNLTANERLEHVNQCLDLQIKHDDPKILPKQQKSLLSYPTFSHTVKKASLTSVKKSSTNYNCQICGVNFTVKRTYLSHLKKCSTKYGVQLSYVVNFAGKECGNIQTIPNSNDNSVKKEKKTKVTNTIKNRVLKLEIPQTKDDEQQHLAIALSSSIKSFFEPPPVVEQQSTSSKTISDITKTKLYSISNDIKIQTYSARLSTLCERLTSNGEYADKLRDLVASGDEKIKERLFIDLNPETRKGRVKFDDIVFKATLYDLPCIIESYKTFDRKTLYKIADISQLLVCRLPNDHSSSEDDEKHKNLSDIESKTKKKKEHEKKFQWPHGITPPLKNVRKRRFRKVARQKTQDHAEIEKEVRRLFRADNEAVSVKFEVMYDEEETTTTTTTAKHSNHHTTHEKEREKEDVAQTDLFGGAVSESDDEASQTKFSMNSDVPGSVGEPTNDRIDFEGLFSSAVGDLPTDMSTDIHLDTDAIHWGQNEELSNDTQDEIVERTDMVHMDETTKTKLSECRGQLDRLNEQKKNFETELNQMTNPVLKSMVMTRLNSVQAQIDKQQSEFEQLTNQ
ncbi:unnamed protein product, partial [Didymodactylos carnosus]